MTSYIKTNTHISIVFDNGEPATVYGTNPLFGDLCEAIKNNDWELAYDIAVPVQQVKKTMAIFGDRVVVEDGLIKLDGNEIHNTLTDRMLQMVDEGFDISPMAAFLANLYDNPSFRAVNELYGFLEKSNLPITEDGHFLAYKRVDGNFMDCYTHKLDNSPGKIVEMPRNEVNEDKNQTCSYGLHFCSREYLPFYGGYGDSKVVMVKINPRDVVSIPTDYNNAKGRCCRYEVVRELFIDENSTERGRLPEKIEGLVDLNTKCNILETTSEILGIVQIYGDRVINSFASARQAQEFTGVDASSINKVCKGKRHTAGGYKWQYKLNVVDVLDEDDAARADVNNEYDDIIFNECDNSDLW